MGRVSLGQMSTSILLSATAPHRPHVLILISISPWRFCPSQRSLVHQARCVWLTVMSQWLTAWLLSLCSHGTLGRSGYAAFVNIVISGALDYFPMKKPTVIQQTLSEHWSMFQVNCRQGEWIHFIVEKKANDMYYYLKSWHTDMTNWKNCFSKPAVRAALVYYYELASNMTVKHVHLNMLWPNKDALLANIIVYDEMRKSTRIHLCQKKGPAA